MASSQSGSRNGAVRETTGWSGILCRPTMSFLLNPVRAASAQYAAAEVTWYLSGSSRVDALLPYAPSYERFAENDGTVHGAYGARFANDDVFRSTTKRLRFQLVGIAAHTQVAAVIELLRREPDTRRAMITAWRCDDLLHALAHDVKEVPCTTSLQFLLRRDVLELVTTMRSNDVWLGMPYDVFAFTCLQHVVASALSVERGKYVHQVGSLHAYEANWDKLEAATSDDVVRRNESLRNEIIPEWKSQVPVSAACKSLVNVEQVARHRHIDAAIEIARNQLLPGTMYRDLAECILAKMAPRKFNVGNIAHLALREATQRGERRC